MGGWGFVWRGFSVQMILLEHRLREEEAGLGVSSGRGGETAPGFGLVQYLKNLLFHTEVLQVSRGPKRPGIEAHAMLKLHMWNKMRANSPRQSLR